MKIANIIYEDQLINHNKVDYINYLNNEMSIIDIDNNLPILYVGWLFMKKCNINNQIIENANILEKRMITNELYWEFSFKENKSSHINGVEKFIKEIPYTFFSSKYNYINLDPVFFQLRNLEDLMDIVPKRIEKIYFFKNEAIYFLYDNKITGISLKQYEFFKFNVSEIIDRLSLRSDNLIFDNDSDLYIKQRKIFPNFQYLKRYMVVIIQK